MQPAPPLSLDYYYGVGVGVDDSAQKIIVAVFAPAVVPIGMDRTNPGVIAVFIATADGFQFETVRVSIFKLFL